MNISISNDKSILGREAALEGAEKIREALRDRGEANIILATGASQFEMFESLTGITDIKWEKVRAFHLDEYIGLSENHRASFVRYLTERFVKRVENLGDFVPIKGNAGRPEEECRRVNGLIEDVEIDAAFIGIGENAHLAFNDPPADFDTDDPFIIVELDEACRKQQLGEGWFNSMEEVPKQAISMTVRQILKSRHIIVSVPDRRKAKAVKCAVEGPINPLCPASALKNHSNCSLFLDRESASLLSSYSY